MGIEFIKPGINIDFLGRKKWGFFISFMLIFFGLTSLIIKGGPRYGIDFTGGTIVQVRFKGPVSADTIRTALKKIGLGGSAVQPFGPGGIEYLIRAKQTSGELKRLAEKIREVLEERLGKGSVEIRRVEMVGPKVGKDLRKKALLALFYAILAIGIYISGRFEMKWAVSAAVGISLLTIVYLLSLFDVSLSLLVIGAFFATLVLYIILDLRFALGAVIALIHDVFITVGIFSLTNKEIDLPIIAALLTIMGYSLNDTIVVFDRIRENLRRSYKEKFSNIINRSINEVLSRTVLTSLTTLLVLIALFIWGGKVIHNFVFALLIGVIVGTYSSIFIASPTLVALEERKYLLKRAKMDKIKSTLFILILLMLIFSPNTSLAQDKEIIEFPETIEAVGYLRSKPESCAGKILKASGVDRSVLGKGDEVFLQFDQKRPKVGQQYFIYRTSAVNRLWYIHYILGVLKIEKIYKEAVRAKIIRSYDAIHIGDCVMPYYLIPRKIKILKEKPSIKATIVASREGVTEIGWPHIVYIDAGSKDGIKIGHILNVYRKQPPPLPLAYLGQLLVVYVTPEGATAFILKSLEPFHLGDIVK